MAYTKLKRTRFRAQLKKFDEMTECCICSTQTVKSPRTLPCSHTFCLQCLTSYVADKKEGGKISCPICRREWKIPVDGVKDLQQNILVEKLIELVQTPDWASKQASCDVCRENLDNPNDAIPAAEKHCIECHQSMCKECAYHHKRNKITKHHEIINLERLHESTLATITSKACDMHPKKPLVVYCLDCSVPVCEVCFQENHSDHKSEDVKQRADTVKKQLEGAVANVILLSDEMSVVLNQELPKSLLHSIAKTESEIHKRSAELKGLVDQHEKRLLEYLNIVKERRQKTFSAEKTEAEICLSEMENFLIMARELQELDSISDLSSTGTMLVSRAQDLQAKYDKMYKKFKTQENLPFTELVAANIDDLLSYSSGNLIGKIKVNVEEEDLRNDGDPCIYPTQYGEDDYPYADCVYIPEPEHSPYLKLIGRENKTAEPHKRPRPPPKFSQMTACSGSVRISKDSMGYMHRPKTFKALQLKGSQLKGSQLKGSQLKGSVCGITMYQDEIFIIRSESTTIDTISSTSFTQGNPILIPGNKEFQILRKRKQAQNYCGLQDIASCKKKGFIYVSSWQDCLILRIDIRTRSVSGSWEVKNGDPKTLSVTQNGNLLVSCGSEGTVLEYTFDGNLVHEINFNCDSKGPLHTVHFKSERFVVCHGGREAVRENEGVTIIDKYGNVIPEMKPLALPQPRHLAVDSNSNILIAARGCSKVTLWDPVEDSQRVLITLDQEMYDPIRIHLNE